MTAGSDPERLVLSPSSDLATLAAATRRSRRVGLGRNRASRGGFLFRYRSTGNQRENIGVHQTARASRIDIRAENFRATVALALQPSYSGSMSTSISRHDLVDSGAPTTRTQLLTVAARSSTPATTSRPKRAKLVVAARIGGASGAPQISIAPLLPMCQQKFRGESHGNDRAAMVLV
jgi:hypothetical protein